MSLRRRSAPAVESTPNRLERVLWAGLSESQKGVGAPTAIATPMQLGGVRPFPTAAQYRPLERGIFAIPRNEIATRFPETETWDSRVKKPLAPLMPPMWTLKQPYPFEFLEPATSDRLRHELAREQRTLQKAAASDKGYYIIPRDHPTLRVYIGDIKTTDPSFRLFESLTTGPQPRMISASEAAKYELIRIIDNAHALEEEQRELKLAIEARDAWLKDSVFLDYRSLGWNETDYVSELQLQEKRGYRFYRYEDLQVNGFHMEAYTKVDPLSTSRTEPSGVYFGKPSDGYQPDNQTKNDRLSTSGSKLPLTALPSGVMPQDNRRMLKLYGAVLTDGSPSTPPGQLQRKTDNSFPNETPTIFNDNLQARAFGQPQYLQPPFDPSVRLYLQPTSPVQLARREYDKLRLTSAKASDLSNPIKYNTTVDNSTKLVRKENWSAQDTVYVEQKQQFDKLWAEVVAEEKTLDEFIAKTKADTSTREKMELKAFVTVIELQASYDNYARAEMMLDEYTRRIDEELYIKEIEPVRMLEKWGRVKEATSVLLRSASESLDRLNKAMVRLREEVDAVAKKLSDAEMKEQRERLVYAKEQDVELKAMFEEAEKRRQQKSKEDRAFAALAQMRAQKRQVAEALAAAKAAAATGAGIIYLAANDPFPPKPSKRAVVVKPAKPDAKAAVRKLLSSILPSDLGKGSDQEEPWDEGYKSLELVNVYDIDYSFADAYISMYGSIRTRMEDLMASAGNCSRGGRPPPEECTRTDQAFKGVDLDNGGRAKTKLGKLDEDVNEKLLVHGTSTDVVEKIIKNGFTRAFAAGAAFGPGIYMAEDAGKNDQYCKSGRRPWGRGRKSGALLAPTPEQAAGAEYLAANLRITTKDPVYYILVCRTILGCAAHVAGGSASGSGPQTNAKDIRDAQRVYNNAGDANAPGVHSVVVEHRNVIGEARGIGQGGLRFREFVIGETGQLLPIFLIAYKRSQNEPRGKYGDLDCK